MKTVTPLILSFLLLLITNLRTQAQCEVPNGNFESVGTEILEVGDRMDTVRVPTDWSPFLGIFNLVFNPDARLGISAVAPGVPPADSALLIRTAGPADFPWDAISSFPCTTKATGIQFDVKYQGNSSDTLDVLVLLTKYDAMLDSSLTIAGLSGTLTGIAPGEFGTVTTDLTYLDEESDIDSVLILFTVYPDTVNNVDEGFVIDNVSLLGEVSGTEDLIVDDHIKLYPNPVVDQLTLDYGDEKVDMIHIFNASGQLVLEQAAAQQQIQVPVGHLPKGIYLVRSQIADRWVVRRFVKP